MSKPKAPAPVADVTDRDELEDVYDLAVEIRSICRAALAAAMGTEIADTPFDSLPAAQTAPYIAVAKWHYDQTAHRNSEANVQRLRRAARAILDGFTPDELELSAPEFAADMNALSEALSQIRITS